MYTCFLQYHTVCKIRPSKSNATVHLILNLANICPKHPGFLTQYKNETEVHDTIGVFKQVPYATASDPLQQHLGSPVVPEGHTSCAQYHQPGVAMWWQCCRRGPRLCGPCGAAADRDYRVAVPLRQPCQQHRGALASLKWIRCLKYPTSISVVLVVLSLFFYMKSEMRLWRTNPYLGPLKRWTAPGTLQEAAQLDPASLRLVSEPCFPDRTSI